MHKAVTTLTVCVLLASASPAAGPDKAILPNSAAWVVHVDVAAFTRAALPSGLMNLIIADNSPIPAEKVSKARTIWQRLGKVKSVTLYGPSHVEAEAVAVASLEYDAADVKKLLRIAPGPATHRIAGHDVYVFEARRRRGRGGGRRFLCFYDKSTLVAGGSLDRLNEAADLLAGQGQKLAADSELAKLLTPTAGSVAIVAARRVDELVTGATAARPRRRPRRAAFLKKTDTLRMEIGEANDAVFLALRAAMKTEQDAINAEKAANGLLGMLLLSQNGDQTLTQVLQSVAIERQDSAVSLAVRCPVNDLLSKAETFVARHVAGGRHRKARSRK